MAQRLAVANQKGGVGKTTTALNLASVFALGGRRTLLMDLDPQGNATTGLGLLKEPKSGVEAVLAGKDPQLVSPAGQENLFVLPAGPSGSSLPWLQANAARDVLPGLESVATGFDCVVVDLPPALEGIPRVVLGWVDRVLVPVPCEFFAMEGLAQFLALLDTVRAERGSAPELAGVLLTMVDHNLAFHREVEENIRGHLGARVLSTIIPRDIRLAEAVSHGVPAMVYDPWCRGAFAYLALGKELESHGGAQTR